MQVTATVSVKLDVTDEVSAAFEAVCSAYVVALNQTSEVAFRTGVVNPVALHHLSYRDVRAATRLPANLACSARAFVAEAYKREPKPKRRHSWKPSAAVRYDARTLTLKLETEYATLTTMTGRVRARLVISDFHRRYLDGSWQIASSATLTSRRGVWYLHLVCTREVHDSTAPGVLGVDAGIKRIATTSNATVHGGGSVSHLRRRHFRKRRSLQTGHKTRGQRRLLKRLGQREHRAVEWKLWNIANEIVREAIKIECGTIAVEDLTHIRTRIRSAKKQRLIQQSWPFASLQEKLAHVASRVGILTKKVDARYTSQTCNRCGHREKTNRPDQSSFRCKLCSHTQNADLNAAFNIRDRCVVPESVAGNPTVSTRPLAG